jgi:hypothetical protein
MLMTSPNPEIRVHEIRTRHLEIQATLAEWKRAWFVDGIERPYGDRLALEAEDARLALERRVLEDAAFKAKLVRREQERKTLVYQLIAVLNERGLQDVITEAESRSEVGVMPSSLIATAPEMLASLRHTVRFWDQLNANDINEMRALIARATGEIQ